MDIIDLFKSEGVVSENLKIKIVDMWDQIVKESSLNNSGASRDTSMNNKQILGFISGTLPVFTFKYAPKIYSSAKSKDDSSLFDSIKSECEWWINSK